MITKYAAVPRRQTAAAAIKTSKTRLPDFVRSLPCAEADSRGETASAVSISAVASGSKEGRFGEVDAAEVSVGTASVAGASVYAASVAAVSVAGAVEYAASEDAASEGAASVGAAVGLPVGFGVGLSVGSAGETGETSFML